MVRIAKEANACWKIRKTVIVDLDKLEAYLENQCNPNDMMRDRRELFIQIEKAFVIKSVKILIW